MKYVERQPKGELRADIECLWAVWDDAPDANRASERIVPDGCPELILHLGDGFARLGGAGSWQGQPRAFFAGTLGRPWILQPGLRPRTIGIRFRPGAAPRLLGVPMEGTSDRETPLGQLLGGSGLELEERVGDALEIEGALSAAEAWLTRRRSSTRFREGESGSAVRLILARRGAIRIEDAARSLSWSRRRLERAFARDVGVSPKRFARIVRLNAVLASLSEPERPRAVDVALEAGYFDQSHLLRDFHHLAGAAPRRLGGGELSRQLVRPERLRALLLGE